MKKEKGKGCAARRRGRCSRVAFPPPGVDRAERSWWSTSSLVLVVYFLRRGRDGHSSPLVFLASVSFFSCGGGWSGVPPWGSSPFPTHEEDDVEEERRHRGPHPTRKEWGKEEAKQKQKQKQGPLHREGKAPLPHAFLSPPPPPPPPARLLQERHASE